MKTAADIYIEKGAKIPEEKLPEFRKRMEKLCQAGGMMQAETISMSGHKCHVLRTPVMGEDGMSFNYNYFEEEIREAAGFDAENDSVWSNEIGQGEFRRTVLAAYMLEALYTEGAAAILLNGEIVDDGEGYLTGWINFLFDGNYKEKNRNPWFLYEAVQKDDPDECPIQDIGWDVCCYEPLKVAGYACIYAVKNGIENTRKWFDEIETERASWKTVNQAFHNMAAALKTFKKKSDLPENEQFSELCEAIKMCCRPEIWADDFSKKYDRALNPVFEGVANCGLLPAAVKAVSELYEKEFWELWEQFRPDMILLDEWDFYGCSAPIPTVDFFRQKPDDMAYYWTKRLDICFSEKMERWLKRQKKKFDKIMQEGLEISNPVDWILTLMEYAEKEYGNVFAFADFFEETLAHPEDERYLALWKIYERMLYDHDMRKEGSSKNSRARILLKRYMALVGNYYLRWKIFQIY